MGVVKGWEGRFYEDFEVGDVYRSRMGRTISEVDNTWFTNLTMNTNQSHFNQTFAEASPFGKILVNSCFTLSLVTGLSVTDVSENAMANLAWDGISLPNPVFVGDTLWCESEVLEKRESEFLCRLEGGVDLWIRGNGATLGSKMLVSVRPEKIHLHRTQPESRENVFPARITNEVFKGAVDDMTVVTQGGLELGVLLANEGATGTDFHEGEQVWCSIHPQDISLLTREV
jgi:acyl dehydratase